MTKKDSQLLACRLRALNIVVRGLSDPVSTEKNPILRGIIEGVILETDSLVELIEQTIAVA